MRSMVGLLFWIKISICPSAWSWKLVDEMMIIVTPYAAFKRMPQVAGMPPLWQYIVVFCPAQFAPLSISEDRMKRRVWESFKRSRYRNLLNSIRFHSHAQCDAVRRRVLERKASHLLGCIIVNNQLLGYLPHIPLSSIRLIQHAQKYLPAA